jgi:hypothetical protein
MRWGLVGWRLRQQREQRQQSHSRPRVAQAAEAARIAQESVGRNLGSATAGVGVMLTSAMATTGFTDGFAPVITPAFKMDAVEASAGRGLTAELALATYHAAQALGRAPEDIWAEALRAWLGSEGSVPRAARPVVQEVRRAHVWSQIDETLHELRAG